MILRCEYFIENKKKNKRRPHTESFRSGEGVFFYVFINWGVGEICDVGCVRYNRHPLAIVTLYLFFFECLMFDYDYDNSRTRPVVCSAKIIKCFTVSITYLRCFRWLQ